MQTSRKTYSFILLLFITQLCVYGQTTPPDWFTYPREGEYVGVSVKMSESYGENCEVKSAVMSAFLSYFLQKSKKDLRFGQISHSYNSTGVTTTKSSTELHWNEIIGYDLVRLEKDKDGLVWVAIKPITDQKSHNLGYLKLNIKGFEECLKEKNKQSTNASWNATGIYVTLQKDTILFEATCGESYDDQHPNVLHQSVMYNVQTIGSFGVLRGNDQPKKLTCNYLVPKWMSQQTLSKGLGNITPTKATSSNVGASFLLCQLKALMQPHLYEFKKSATNNLADKKATKTHAVFFDQTNCYLYNQ